MSPVARFIHRHESLTAWLYLGLIICAVGAMALLYHRVDAQNQRLQEQADQNTTSLRAHCIERRHLDQDIAVTRGILKRHRGRLVFGLPRQLFVAGLHKNQERRHELQILDCKE